MVKTVGELGKDRAVGILTAALADKMAGRMDQSELYAICIDWSYHYALDDLIAEPLPLSPEEVIKYQRLSAKERSKIREINSSVWSAVQDFYRKLSAVKVRNQANREWLREMLDFYEKKGDEVKAARVREVLNEC